MKTLMKWLPKQNWKKYLIFRKEVTMAGQETIAECKYKNATVRIHFPDRSKEEQTEKIKAATEDFFKKVMQREGNEKKK